MEYIKKHDTVIIIGSHPKTREVIDFDMPADVWVFNEAVSVKSSWVKRADAVFQIHQEAIWRNPHNRNDGGHLNWLKTQTEIPVFMQDVYPDVPASVRYPLEDAKLLAGVYLDAEEAPHFLTSSPALAIALAILLGYKKIMVYGIAMETNTEYQWQRDGVSFWQGFAKGRGLEFHFEDDTFNCLVYGYQGMAVIAEDSFTPRISELAPRVSNLSDMYRDVAGEVQAKIKKMEAGENDLEGVYKTIERCVTAGEKLGEVDGALQTNMKYMEKADAMKKNAGGQFAISRQEFESAAKNLLDKRGDTQADMNGIGGQMDLVLATIQNAAKGSPKRRNAVEAFVILSQKYVAASNMIAIYKGAAEENFRYMGILERGVRSIGGVKSERVILEGMGIATEPIPQMAEAVQ